MQFAVAIGVSEVDYGAFKRSMRKAEGQVGGFLVGGFSGSDNCCIARYSASGRSGSSLRLFGCEPPDNDSFGAGEPAQEEMDASPIQGPIP